MSGEEWSVWMKCATWRSNSLISKTSKTDSLLQMGVVLGKSYNSELHPYLLLRLCTGCIVSVSVRLTAS